MANETTNSIKQGDAVDNITMIKDLQTEVATLKASLAEQSKKIEYMAIALGFTVPTGAYTGEVGTNNNPGVNRTSYL